MEMEQVPAEPAFRKGCTHNTHEDSCTRNTQTKALRRKCVNARHQHETPKYADFTFSKRVAIVDASSASRGRYARTAKRDRARKSNASQKTVCGC